MVLASQPLRATTIPYRYDIGSPILQSIYVNPTSGNDTNNGAIPSLAKRTVTAAWQSIPRGTTLTSTGYQIILMPGTYDASVLPNYWEDRHGTAQFPIIITSQYGHDTVTLTHDLNIANVDYLYLIGLTIAPASDVVHCERCRYLLIRDSVLDGGNRQAHETLKINQSQYVYLEHNTITGADDNAVDYVAVQYGHIVGNTISNAGDWCLYTKGGSAYHRIEGNIIHTCGTGGYTAGQGTGFEYMTSPWLHYEAYDIKFVNNIIHHTEGAGFGVNGGYNILLAY
ncbi:MAG: right-handed parallel beta-helix repeat-containing protein, partial [Roseiflexaceae bacterium]